MFYFYSVNRILVGSLKKIILLNVVLIYMLFVVSFSCAQVKQKSNEKLVNGAYCAGYTLRNEEYVTKMNFSDFDFYYLMCYPKWNVIDLDLPFDTILSKYVTNYSYPDSKSGYGLAVPFIEAVHKAGGKVLLSMLDNNFAKVANNAIRRQNAAKMLAMFIQKFNYDGFDLDWEQDIDLTNHYLFLQDLRKELDSISVDRHYYITTALSMNKRFSQKQADQLSSCIDWINVMAYDLGGGVGDIVPKYNAPMGIIKDLIKNYDVFERSKICIGLTKYGYHYKGIKPGIKTPKGKTLRSYGEYIGYIEFQQYLEQGWKEQWSEREKVAYYFSPDEKDFITIDSPRAIEYKIQYIINQGFRGVFWWEMYHDFVIDSSDAEYGKMILFDQVEGLMNNKMK